MTFSDKLIALRKKAGWSQEELAERLNVSRQSVSSGRAHSRCPTLTKFYS
ncbi:helix-turn-helix domain-containing protein [Gemmiger formicilis]|nr:helix-turn-helix domain-containing protein [Gemmiger formicilis]